MRQTRSPLESLLLRLAWTTENESISRKVTAYQGSQGNPRGQFSGTLGKPTKSQYLAQEWIQPTKSATTKYVSVNGDPVPMEGMAQVNLSVSNRSININVVLSPAITNEIIIGRGDLKGLGVIPKQFPTPIYIVSENRYSSMRDALINNNPDVLTDELPKSSMDTGRVSMKIHLTPGEKCPSGS